MTVENKREGLIRCSLTRPTALPFHALIFTDAPTFISPSAPSDHLRKHCIRSRGLTSNVKREGKRAYLSCARGVESEATKQATWMLQHCCSPQIFGIHGLGSLVNVTRVIPLLAFPSDAWLNCCCCFRDHTPLWANPVPVL